jgi:murein DD-endopeptidase MepM/ murein hydrolase activator NlpD
VVVAVPTSTTTSTVTTTTVAPTTTVPPPTTRPSAPGRPAGAAAARAPRPAGARNVTEQPWTPFATVGGITLRHPSSRVERVGFHEANHDGARQLEPLASAVAPVTLESRERPTDSRTAADIVVDPATEIRAPATGTVKVAGSYILYCEHSDDYVIIEPDEHPGWQVKILHIDGLQVSAGQRVTAGQTVVASRPTQLPFASQVDEVATASPAWPHTHIEVIDPSIPDIPSPGGGC